MTQDEIIRMAREAGAVIPKPDFQDYFWRFHTADIERFSALVSAKAFAKGFAEGAEATKEKAIIVCEQAFDAPEETMWNAAIEYVRKRLE